MLGRPARSNLPSRGLWRIVDDRIMAVDRSWDGPTTVLVPSEDVLNLAVDLPFATRRQREAALPFAVEDAAAEPLSALHCALGVEIGPRRHLAGVVRHARMREWLAMLATADLDPAILTPDALMLPLPSAGAWSVRIDEGRALVRTDQATGFALPARDLPTVWSAAGRPRLQALGGALPEAMQDGVEAETLALGSTGDPVVVIPPLDLRQGLYAAVRKGELSWARTLAMVAGVGVLAHLAILAVDTLVLDGMADRREVEARAMLAQVSPTLAPGEDIVAAADRIAPRGGGAKPFTGLLARTSQALPAAGGVAFSSLAYADAGQLDLGVIVADPAALDQAVAALNGAGLSATGSAGPPAATGVSGTIRIEGGAR